MLNFIPVTLCKLAIIRVNAAFSDQTLPQSEYVELWNSLLQLICYLSLSEYIFG